MHLKSRILKNDFSSLKIKCSSKNNPVDSVVLNVSTRLAVAMHRVLLQVNDRLLPVFEYRWASGRVLNTNRKQVIIKHLRSLRFSSNTCETFDLLFLCVVFIFFPSFDHMLGQELYNALKGATSFAVKAAREKGRILILGDQGVNRSATLTVIFNVLSLQPLEQNNTSFSF